MRGVCPRAYRNRQVAAVKVTERRSSNKPKFHIWSLDSSLLERIDWSLGFRLKLNTRKKIITSLFGFYVRLSGEAKTEKEKGALSRNLIKKGAFIF